MSRQFVSVFLLCCLLASRAFANEAVVSGIAAGDLLNVRQDPSPLGRTLGRLPNGSLLARHDCQEVDGYEWCRVSTLEGEELSGWTPGRYLSVLDVTDESVASVVETPPGAQAPGAEAAAADPAQGAAAVPIPTPAPRPAMPDDPAAETKMARLASEGEATDAAPEAAPEPAPEPEPEPEVTVPHGLEARFGGEPSLPSSAKRAFASAALATGSVPLRQLGTARQAPAQMERADEAAAAPAVPVPTPRPGAPGEARQDAPAETVVAAGDGAFVVARGETGPARQPGEEISGEIPCARYIGQPMTRCTALALRKGPNAADVTVTWPDGGSRVIEFRDGAPTGSNSRGEFRFTREGGLNMIRVGISERFEITDALPFGD